jgi:UDP-galactopyranose mutase
MKFDWLIVGAGLSGATFAERIASQRNESVLIIDQRDHIAGNTWDEYNEQGILEHKYGPHIFHTNSKEVWDYLSKFTEWRPYFHKVLASVDGMLIPLPFNLNSIDMLFPEALSKKLSEKLINTYGFGNRVPILKLREAEDRDLCFLAEFVYQNVFEKYTNKQWGFKPEELSPSVTARVPIIVSRDDRYFQDTFQAMPKNGYGSMVRNMLKNSKIHTLLNTRWDDIKDKINFNRVIFTGPIDEYFGFKYGKLPYRSLYFDVKTLSRENYQSAAVINYPNEYEFTRITEQKWLTGQKSENTTIITEYPIEYIYGENIPYYPIPTENNKNQFKKYESEVGLDSKKTIFSGRLADYTYYNMDQAVASALSKFRKI